MLATALFWIGAQGKALFNAIGLPWWITGFIWDGVYLAMAWVVAVMLPPMAIFFPLFTFLEDLGYLPRVAFNLDFLFKKAGAHGKQSLSMTMGFGCNAAGVIATRVIELAARAADRHPDQQFRAVQWALPHLDHARNRICRCRLSTCIYSPGGIRFGYGDCV